MALRDMSIRFDELKVHLGPHRTFEIATEDQAKGVVLFFQAEAPGPDGGRRLPQLFVPEN